MTVLTKVIDGKADPQILKEESQEEKSKEERDEAPRDRCNRVYWIIFLVGKLNLFLRGNTMLAKFEFDL